MPVFSFNEGFSPGNYLTNTIMLEEQVLETQNESPVSSEASCTECAQAREQAHKSDELSFAFLLALVPALTLSLFGNIGLL